MLRLTDNFYEVDLTVLLPAQDGFKYMCSYLHSAYVRSNTEIM